MGEETEVCKSTQHEDTGVDSRFCCNICLDPVVDPVTTLCGHLYCWPCLFRWLEPGMDARDCSFLGIRRNTLTVDPSHRVCPVCKAPCSALTLVPIYVRASEDGTNQNSKLEGAPSYEKKALHVGLDRDNGTAEAERGLPDGYQSGVSTGLLGLRQRLRFRSRDSELSADSVPSHPPMTHSSSPAAAVMPNTPQRYPTNHWVAPLTPTGHQGSLTHGLLLSLQLPAASRVPPLHGRQGGNPGDLDTTPGASEYLSRVLVMLASFVILCLLLM